MGTKSPWAAAILPFVLVAIIGVSLAHADAVEELRQSLSIVLLLAVIGLAWYGGRNAGIIAALLVTCTIWIAPLLAERLRDVRQDVPVIAMCVESIALLLAAMLTGGLRDAREQAEAALAERDARLALVSQQLPAILWSTDTELNVTTSMGMGGLSTAGEDGGSEHPTATSIGTFLQHLDPSSASSPARAVHMEALRGAASTYEVGWRDRSFQCHLEPLRNPDADIIGVVGVAVEITERKRAEEHLQAAKDLAETATRYKDRFLAMLSHELRTPLTPVLAAASVLRSDPSLPERTRDDLEMIHRNVELEVRLIDDLLDLTRISKGKLEFRFETEDVHGLLRSTIDMCRDEAASKRLTIREDLAAAHHHVAADGARLRQVFWNLLKNSVKFTPDDGRITIRTQEGADGRVIVDVIDTGVGIEPNVLPHVFDAFVQGGATVTRSYGGLGLGLAISKALIEAHHGRLEAHSDGQGRGATFRIELPVVPAPATTLAPQAESPPHAAPETQRARPLEILLVEDHYDTARVLKRLLDGSGYHVRTADSVNAALAVAASEPVDLLVSDLGLPDGTGFDLMRQLLARRPLKGIALSGFGTDQDIERSREAGFACHLTKPVDFRRLEEAIEQVACVAC
jgi:signal transduction histidine kinase/CheY-like chemotaxis protein